jgi:glycosyltransferase involved in cell wall biosynthesis
VSKKVLIITYYWPPSGGAGVQRWVKFAKYLPEFGWEPVILTVDPKYAAYPVTDNSLEKEISPDLQVYRTPATDYFALFTRDRTKIPSAGFAINPDNSLKGKISRFVRGNFFIPDPRKGWNRHAFRKASELITSMDIRHVITTSPPHSTQLIGLRLKKTFPGIRWIADLRDPWTDIYYYRQFYPTFISEYIDSYFERKTLQNSDSIITVGPSLKKLFASKVREAAAKTGIITNGYDNDDFTGAVAIPGKFTITYAGTLADIYPLNGFLEAVARLKAEKIEFVLKFIGGVSKNQRELIMSKLSGDDVISLPYSDHVLAIRHLRESSVLLLIIPNHPGNRSIVTGKLFEYLASGRPVICLGPSDGDAAAIISRTGHGRSFSYDDSANMGDYLAKLASGPLPALPAPAEYSRRQLTARLASFLQNPPA